MVANGPHSNNVSKTDEVERQVLKKYELEVKLGKGAYGVVWKAKDRRSTETVALKKIFDAFQNSTDAQRTFREIMFLRRIRHENIVRLINVIKADHSQNDIYLVFDYMETDLHAVIRAEILQNIHKRFIIYQLLKALKYMHSGSLLHRDMKPSNILLNSDCSVKVADFGLARSIATHAHPSQNPVLTDYVATRWYRAPEILCGSTKYTKGVDLWSLGCILGELISGKPIFPGTSTLNQLERVVQLVGKPSEEDIESIESTFASTMIQSLREGTKKTFETVFPHAEPDAIDLLKRLLLFNPEKRITAEEALKHPYVAKFHDERTEPRCHDIITIPIDDNVKYDISDYKAKVYEMIKHHRRSSSKASAVSQTMSCKETEGRALHEGSLRRAAAAQKKQSRQTAKEAANYSDQRPNRQNGYGSKSHTAYSNQDTYHSQPQQPSYPQDVQHMTMTQQRQHNYHEGITRSGSRSSYGSAPVGSGTMHSRSNSASRLATKASLSKGG